jgi:type VI secretion system protein ImpA
MDMPILKDLTKPISKKEIAGADLRENAAADSLYYQIKDARLAARKAERDLISGDTQAENPNEHWQSVLKLGQDILTKHSKDLEISCWLTESLLRIHGLPGLTFGFDLMNELMTQYWEKLYPLPDEDGISTTVMALSGLNGMGNEGSLIQPIKDILVTNSNNEGSFAFWEYQQAIMVEQIPDKEKRERHFAEGAIKLKTITKAALSTPKTFYTDTYHNIDAALNAFEKLTKTCEEKCGQDAPPSSQIKNTLLELQDHLRMLAKMS